MIEIGSSINIFQALIFIGIGLFGISLGGIFSSIFGGSKPSAQQTADLAAQKAREHEIAMAKQAAELAKQKAVVQEANSKRNLMYIGIGGGVFMMMMMMMVMKR